MTAVVNRRAFSLRSQLLLCTYLQTRVCCGIGITPFGHTSPTYITPAATKTTTGYSYYCTYIHTYIPAVGSTSVSWKPKVGMSEAPGLLATAGRNVDHPRLFVLRAVGSPPVTLSKKKKNAPGGREGGRGDDSGDFVHLVGSSHTHLLTSCCTAECCCPVFFKKQNKTLFTSACLQVRKQRQQYLYM